MPKKTTRSAPKPAIPVAPAVESSEPRRPAAKFYRNLHGCQAAIRIGDRRIELAPRGMRGDIAPLKPDEEYDDKFLVNKGLLFEVISFEEASRAIDGQTTNQQVRVDSNLQRLRQIKGENAKVTLESESGHEIKMAEKSTNSDGSTRVVVTREGTVNQPSSTPQEGVTPAKEVGIIEEGVGPTIVQRPGSESGPAIQKPPENLPPEQVGEWLAQQRSNLFNPNEG